MKRLLGIAIVAVGLSTAAGCAARGFRHYGPPPPPPPPREVVMGRSHAGRVWVPGHYRWIGHRYVWVEGRWVRPPRHGQVWVPGHRAPRRGVYVWVEGYWR